MALTDNILYRLKPEFGDSSPHNELNNSDILTGGTFLLVDRSGGAGTDMAWRHSGADSSVLVASKTVTPSGAASGYTIAVTVKVVTNPSGGTGFTSYVRHQNSSNSAVFLGLSQDGANNIRGRYAASSGAVSVSIATVGTTEFTYVLRVSTNGSGQEKLDIWIQKTGRVDTTPDKTGSLTSLTTTLNQLVLGGQNDVVLEFKDIVIWSDEKPDAECAVGADNLRGMLDAPAAVTGTINWTEAADTVAITGDVEISGVAGTINWTEAADTVAVTGTVASDVATITTDPFANWVEEDPILSETIPNVMVIALDRTVVLSLADQVTDASTGRLVISDEALETGEWYMVACFDEDGTNRGIDVYQAT